MCRPFTTSVSFGVPHASIYFPCKMILHGARPCGMKSFEKAIFKTNELYWTYSDCGLTQRKSLYMEFRVMYNENVRFSHRFSKRLLPYPQIASQYRFVKMVPIYDKWKYTILQLGNARNIVKAKRTEKYRSIMKEPVKVTVSYDFV